MKPLKSLIVEDSKDDALLLLRHLSSAGYDVQSAIVQTPAAMKAALAECEWDIILSDYAMPHFTGLDALSILKESGLDIPFIIISGTIGEDVAVEAMLVGVHEYLMKGNLTRLAPAIEREIQNAASRRARQQAEEALRRSEASLVNAQRIAHIGNWDWDIQNNQLFWSEEVYRIFGLTKTQFDGTYESFLGGIHPEDRQLVQSAVEAALSRIAPYNIEHRITRPNGDERIVCEIGEVTFDKSDKPVRLAGTVQEITERKLAERIIKESEERYRIVAETASDVIITIDERGSILFVNQAAEKVLGYKPEELIGSNVAIITPERFRVAHIAGIRRYLQTGERRISWSGTELPALRRDGREIQIEISFGEYRENGKRLFTAVLRDITKRKRAEQLIVESEEKYRNIVETANEGILLTDVDGHVIFINRQMTEMLGYTVDEMLGRTIFDFIFEDDFSTTKCKIEQRRQGNPQTGEFRLRRKDGSEIITLYNISPTKNQAGEIVGFLSMNTDITERKNADQSRRQAEANYRNLVESLPVIVYLAEPSPPFAPIYVSPNINWFGYTTEEWFEKPDTWLSIIHDEDREHVLSTTADAMQRGLDTDLEYRIISRDGTTHWLHDKGRFVSDDKGKRVGWQGVIIDITETKRLEEQLKQAQKLESVGRLAGGIAHDFNNMLTAINGYSELTLRTLEGDHPLRRNIEEIKKAGERSALLTHQLLAFSRQQVLQPVVLDLNEVVTDTAKMLERMIGEDVQLIIALEPETGLVNVDPGQLSQIIMNLAVNARDAMPQGGTLTIETANLLLEPGDAKQKVGIPPGAYVMLAVCDTGHGIDDKIRQHIFEPFFTTKEIGRGTGLGLATVYGIVKQSGGNIEVESKVGAGTNFRIYLPRVAEQSKVAEIKDTSTELPVATETILLVEDEELVRNLSREILETCGYMVIEARNGLEALEIYENGDCKIDLLMTDVVMPQMGGRELAEKLAERLPNLQILFTSGHTDNATVRHGVSKTSINFIQKPFTFDALARKVRELLNARDFKAKK